MGNSCLHEIKLAEEWQQLQATCEKQWTWAEYLRDRDLAAWCPVGLTSLNGTLPGFLIALLVGRCRYDDLKRAHVDDSPGHAVLNGSLPDMLGLSGQLGEGEGLGAGDGAGARTIGAGEVIRSGPAPTFPAGRG